MRDFRDAKAMAHALRGALKDKSIETTHSESLELVAKAFGCEDWNILSAKIAAAQPRDTAGRAPPPAEPGTPATLYCTFCGKSQHDVRALIAGPSSYICDECVVVCNDVLDGSDDHAFFNLLDADEANGDQAYPGAVGYLGGQSTEDLVSFVERRRRGTQRFGSALQSIRFVLAVRDGEAQADDDTLAAHRFAVLRDQSRDELVANRQRTERGLKQSETALRIALNVLDERRR